VNALRIPTISKKDKQLFEGLCAGNFFALDAESGNDGFDKNSSRRRFVERFLILSTFEIAAIFDDRS